ncbi:MAG TPA: zinc-ribbon domain-containing protein [Candidatus Angelobacter sp.]
MLCTFCGTENRPENKFCGMCGVRLERRKAERRNRQDTLKCQSCGHANDPGQKFCGMCGGRVDRRVRERREIASDEPRATAMANAQLPSPEAPGSPVALAPPTVAVDKPQAAQLSPASEVPLHPKTPPAIFRNEPPRPSTISGPSFLGLGDEPQNPGEYLLEDEGSSGSMLRRLVLIAILAAIAGLLFVGWRSSSRANPKTSPPQAQPTASPAAQSKAPDPSSDAAQTDNSRDSSAAKETPSDAKDAKDASPPESKPSPQPETVAGGEDKPLPSGNDALAADRKKTSRDSPADTSPGQHHPSAMLLRAQQYLQGRGGVRQNCEQGLTYLKAATEKNEPAAAVQMGALYASGHCVQRNEVTAYRWFNSAHELDPANHWIQTNLDQLWAQMTPEQRRQITQ